MQQAHHDVVVVGGGLAGLAAAWHLRDLDVLVLEGSDRVGGRIKSEARGRHWLNLGAHVFSGPQSACGRLIEQSGVSAVSVPGTLTAIALDDRIVARGPVESYPFRLPLSPRERVALVRAGLKLRLAVRRYGAVARSRPGEDPGERQLRTLEFLDDRSFTEFSGPLPPTVDAIFRCTLTRSSGEPEALAAGYGVGYFHLVWNRAEGLSRNLMGGSGTLVEALAKGLGGRVRLCAPVRRVEQNASGVSISYIEDGVERTIRARWAVVATPAPITAEIVAGLPRETTHALRSIRYGPYAVGAFLTNESGPMPWDDLYALATPRRSFGMLFNIGNALRGSEPARSPGGSLMVYAGADLGRRMLARSDEKIAEAFLVDLHDLYPVTRDVIAETVVQRWELGLPYPHVGRSRLQGALTRPLGRVHLAGDYLGSWYTETAAQTGEDAAAAIRATSES